MNYSNSINMNKYTNQIKSVTGHSLVWVLLCVIALSAALSCRKTNVETVHKGEPYYTLSYTLRYNAGGVYNFCDTLYDAGDRIGVIHSPHFIYNESLNNVGYFTSEVFYHFNLSLKLKSSSFHFENKTIYKPQDLINPLGFSVAGIRFKTAIDYSFYFEIEEDKDAWQDYYFHFEGIGIGVDIIEEKLGKETLPMDTVRLCNGLFSVGRNLRIEYKNGGPEGYKFYNFIKDPEDGDKNINYHRE